MRSLYKRSFRIIFTLVLLFSVVLAGHSTFAQTDAQKLEQERKLQAELNQVLKEIEEQKRVLQSQRAESASIERDVSILDAQIRQAQLKLEASNIRVQQLSDDIQVKASIISELEDKIMREKDSLSKMLQRFREVNDRTLVEALLSSGSLAEYFAESDSLGAIKLSIMEDLEKIAAHQRETAEQKETLEVIKNQQEDISYQIEAEKKVVEINQNQKEVLLSASRQQEKTYEQIVAEREARAAAIRSELIRFQGSGVDNRSISFGEAYDYAKRASEKTGVRAAFILAIMQQETGFGNNVGGCYVRDASGNGIYISSGNPSIRNMVPTGNNFENFVKITTALGRDWQNTPVSCAYRETDGSYYGYGGAMGYTQFIPSSWMLVEARIRNALGVSTADPWNPEHAVWATAFFTQDKGAAAQTYSAEYAAACGYYGSCSRHDYGTSVLNKAAAIQREINILETF